MKYFIDTEFVEKPNTIELISMGIVSEKGDTFYAESASFDMKICNDWIMKNVVSSLRWRHEMNCKAICGSKGFNNCSTRTIDGRAVTECFGENSFIGKCVNNFITDSYEDGTIEFYGYYADYDWVVFCWLFGKMMDLPKGFPMYCKDIKQMMDEKGNPKKPEQASGEHNALGDAIYHKELYDWIRKYKSV